MIFISHLPLEQGLFPLSMLGPISLQSKTDLHFLFFILNIVRWWEETYQSETDVFPPFLFSFVKWDVNKTLDHFKVLVTENLAILGAEHNRKITSHVLKSISFQLVLQGLGKEGENKTKHV